VIRVLSQARRTGHLPFVRTMIGRGGQRLLSSHEAFEALYFTMADPVLIYLTRRTADPETARDLWAETWARAYEGRAGFRGTSQAEQEAWIRAIGRHVLAGYYRRGNAQRRAMERLKLDRPAIGDRDLDRIERASGLETLRSELQSALAALPRAQREALQLRVVQRLAYAEVAERTGVSEQTVRTRVSRGLKALANTLDRDLADFDLGDWA
jgi:RNA polymerase sigma-70 factor (ECF subfamily)